MFAKRDHGDDSLNRMSSSDLKQIIKEQRRLLKEQEMKLKQTSLRLASGKRSKTGKDQQNQNTNGKNTDLGKSHKNTTAIYPQS